MVATEHDVGVRMFLSADRPGFSATIKHRFTDFLVHEIALDGRVCRLTSEQPFAARAEEQVVPAPQAASEQPALVDSPSSSQEACADALTAAGEGGLLTTAPEPGPAVGAAALPSAAQREAGVEAVRQLAGAEVAERLAMLLQQVQEQELGASGSEPLHSLLPPIADKEVRSKLHGVVREHFGRWLQTDTVIVDKVDGRPVFRQGGGRNEDATANLDRVIRVVYSQSASGKRGRDHRHHEQQQHQPQHQRGTGREGQGKRPRLEHALDRRSVSGHEPWPASRPAFTRFLLYKENVDSQEALSLLKGTLHTREELGTAGTKDKRAVTVQQVTIKHVSPAQVASAVQQLRDKRFGRRIVMHAGNFDFCDKDLSLGDLSGNRFTVLFRNVELSEGATAVADAAVDGGSGGSGPGGSGSGRTGGVRPGPGTPESRAAQEAISEKVRLWAQTGFLNYYGMQRFGTTDVPTHHVGVALLKGDVVTASRLLLRPRGTDDARISTLLLDFADKGGDSKELLRFMPRDMIAARVLVTHLSRVGRGGRGGGGSSDAAAPQGLDRFAPAQLRDALAAVPYNLKTLFVNAYQSFLFNTLLSERVERYGADRVVPGDLVLKPSHTMDAIEMCRDVRIASAEEIAAGAWTIEDVVLPLVGYTLTAFPTHAVGRQRVAELCQLDGVDLLANKSNNRLMPMGSYRHMLIKPRDVQHEWIWYNYERQADLDWNTTDLDRLRGIEPPKQAEGDDINRAALRIAFSLSPSSYATMGFRELMKLPTDRAALKGAPS